MSFTAADRELLDLCVLCERSVYVCVCVGSVRMYKFMVQTENADNTVFADHNVRTFNRSFFVF